MSSIIAAVILPIKLSTLKHKRPINEAELTGEYGRRNAVACEGGCLGAGVLRHVRDHDTAVNADME